MDISEIANRLSDDSLKEWLIAAQRGAKIPFPIILRVEMPKYEDGYEKDNSPEKRRRRAVISLSLNPQERKKRDEEEARRQKESEDRINEVTQTLDIIPDLKLLSRHIPLLLIGKDSTAEAIIAAIKVDHIEKATYGGRAETSTREMTREGVDNGRG